MFHPSPQHVFLTQQVIVLNQTYPCPRCSSGTLEQYGETETFQCRQCQRNFVALKGSRFLYPARQTGYKIAPTYWWDGFHWHWAGSTAGFGQMSILALIGLLPALAVNLAITFHWWTARPDWCNPALLTPLVALLSVQLLYLACWDFDFSRRGRDNQR